MIKTLHLITVCLLSVRMVNAECRCAIFAKTPQQSPATVFTFSDNRRIAACGFKDVHIAESEAEYSDFILSECGADTIIDYWDASENVIISMKNDTLKLAYRELLATGADFQLVQDTWMTEHIFYQNNQLQRKRSVSPDLRYTTEQINATLKAYKRANFRTQNEMKDEKKVAEVMQLANRLMIAAISGNRIAEQYFYDIANKFQPYGTTAEWYDDMAGMIKFAQYGE